jgi:tetratricopeptide (TPR) repeat protein
MKRGQILGMLALLLVCAVTVIPAMAANVNVTTTHDVATDYYNYGELALEAGNYTGAIAYYDQALGSNTTMMNLAGALLYVYEDKSYAQMQMSNYTGALATLDAGLVVYPNDENLLNNKGYAQYNLGMYTDAVTTYNEALANDANFTPALINKGDALVKLGDYQDAVTVYKAALASEPDNPDNTSATAKLAAAEKAAASALPYTLIVLAVVVVVIAAGVAYYVTRKTPADKKAPASPDKKTGKKKK